MNSAGLGSKIMTFRKIINQLKPSVFMVEETKFKDSGKWKLDGYIIYELIRQDREGGGLAFIK